VNNIHGPDRSLQKFSTYDGFPLVAWYWIVWISTAGLCYGALSIGHIDAIEYIHYFEHLLTSGQYDITSLIGPSMGQLGLALVLNEFDEPTDIQVQMVIVTVKPVMDHSFATKFWTERCDETNERQI
jgi:hypothetical protein